MYVLIIIYEYNWKIVIIFIIKKWKLYLFNNKFYLLSYERSGKYIKTNRKLKYNNKTKIMKYESPLKLCGYYSFLNVYTLYVVCGVQYHDLDNKLYGHLLFIVKMLKKWNMLSRWQLMTI